MAVTPISNSTPYISVAEFLKRTDARIVADLCSDNNTRPPIDDLSDTDKPAGGKLYAALQDASGDLETACLLGEKYTPTDLTTLTGNQSAFMKRIVADIALDYLYRRRADPTYQLSVAAEQSKGFLQALVDGSRIFGLQESIDATVLSSEVERPDQVVNRNMITYQAERFFGVRANRR